MIMFHVEFDDTKMKWLDYFSVCDDVDYIITGEMLEYLCDYVQGMGYDWNEVAHVFEVAA